MAKHKPAVGADPPTNRLVRAAKDVRLIAVAVAAVVAAIAGILKLLPGKPFGPPLATSARPATPAPSAQGPVFVNDGVISRSAVTNGGNAAYNGSDAHGHR